MAEFKRFARAPTDAPIEDLTGQRFGELVALRPYSVRSASGRICWVCRCSCGCEVAYESTMLKRGEVKSCGSLSCRYHK